MSASAVITRKDKDTPNRKAVTGTTQLHDFVPTALPMAHAKLKGRREKFVYPWLPEITDSSKFLRDSGISVRRHPGRRGGHACIG
jgi:hypothetical protein